MSFPIEGEFFDDISSEFELIKFTSDVQTAIEQVCHVVETPKLISFPF